MDFSFGDVVIRVPYSDFLLRVQDESCSLGVQKREGEEAGDGEAILGDTFLRGAYGKFSFGYSPLLGWRVDGLADRCSGIRPGVS